jgi:3-dehydroquinate dehydratase / shikimate dehydrogenase
VRQVQKIVIILPNVGMPATIAASITDISAVSSPDFAALPHYIQWLELRGDLLGDLELPPIRSRFSGKIVYTLRSTAEGGSFDGSQDERLARLSRAARQYDLVDLETDSGLDEELLRRVPPDKRILSWSGHSATRAALESAFERMSRIEATLYRITPYVENPWEAIEVLTFLASLGRRDVLAFANGRSGHWTRLIAPHVGAPVVFGWMGDTIGSSGEPSVWSLASDYGFPELRRPTQLFGIVGDPVFHSLSPRIHNAGHRSLNSPGLFVPFETDSFERLWHDLVECDALAPMGMHVRGLTVASPYKENALEFATRLSASVDDARSANLLVRSGDDWIAETTDPDGILSCLHEAGVDPRAHNAAVIGCGGAGRPVALALSAAGAKVTLLNRGLERGQLAHKLLGLPFLPLSQFSPASYSLIVNATPVGRDDRQSPFPVGEMSPNTVVVDLVYGAETTPLIEAARAAGCIAIDGRQILLAEVLCQFRLMSGTEMPRDVAEDVLGYDPELRPFLATNACY